MGIIPPVLLFLLFALCTPRLEEVEPTSKLVVEPGSSMLLAAV